MSSISGFPGREAFEAAAFLSECAARLGFVDHDVRRECPFLLQVGPSAAGQAGRRGRGQTCCVSHFEEMGRDQVAPSCVVVVGSVANRRCTRVLVCHLICSVLRPYGVFLLHRCVLVEALLDAAVVAFVEEKCPSCMYNLKFVSAG